MLRKDLKSGKRLNFIIFLFMAVASVLIVSVSAEIYGSSAGLKISKRKMNIADSGMILSIHEGEEEEFFRLHEEMVESSEHLKEYSFTDAVMIDDDDVSFSSGVKNNYQYYHDVYVSKMPDKVNMVFNSEDQKFEVSDGKAAVPYFMAAEYGVKKGDLIYVTDQSGKVDSYEISDVYKSLIDGMFSFIILSEGDFESFLEHCPENIKMTSYVSDDGEKMMSDLTKFSLMIKEKNIASSSIYSLSSDLSERGESRTAFSTFMVIISVFLVLIIIVTVRFTLLSAVSSEINEIGMLRACGVSSLSFKMLLASKYLAFTAVGGLAGFAVGIPASKHILAVFSADLILPDNLHLICVSALCLLIYMIIILLYIFHLISSIKKITVADMLHGEYRGERFRKMPGVFLHRCRFLPVSIYFAFNDIIRGFRKYIILVFVYSVSVMIFLMGINLKNTFYSERFMEYSMISRIDFSINFESEGIMEIAKTADNMNDFFLKINKEFENNDIPAGISLMNISYGDMILGDGEVKTVVLYYNGYDPSQLHYRKGGSAPVLKNEVALGSYSAFSHGIKTGDKIKIEYTKESESGTQTVTEEFIVTALIDLFEDRFCPVIFSTEFDGARTQNNVIYSQIIVGSKEQKKEYFKKMANIFGEDAFIEEYDLLEDSKNGFLSVINYLVYMTLLFSVFITALVTVLHHSVIVNEETGDTALLRCTGTGISVIWRWRMLKYVILTLVSSVLGIILTVTAGNFIVDHVLRSSGIYGFRLAMDPFDTFVLVPVVVSSAALVVAAVCCRSSGNSYLNKITFE